MTSRHLPGILRPANTPTAGGPAMKIVVIGGSGLIGTKRVKRLRQAGHEVLPAAPNSGVNAFTGEGLAGALKGARVVVDVANSPSFEDDAVMKFFQSSGRNLLAAEAAAGVRDRKSTRLNSSH